MSRPGKPTDSRAFGRQLERELIVGGVLIGVLISVGLVFLFWGASAALTTLTCFVLFGLVIILVWLVLLVMAWLGRAD